MAIKYSLSTTISNTDDFPIEQNLIMIFVTVATKTQTPV